MERASQILTLLVGESLLHGQRSISDHYHGCQRTVSASRRTEFPVAWLALGFQCGALGARRNAGDDGYFRCKPWTRLPPHRLPAYLMLALLAITTLGLSNSPLKDVVATDVPKQSDMDKTCR